MTGTRVPLPGDLVRMRRRTQNVDESASYSYTSHQLAKIYVWHDTESCHSILSVNDGHVALLLASVDVLNSHNDERRAHHSVMLSQPTAAVGWVDDDDCYLEPL